jgi:chemotaxis family two-component system response regulator Rcp1
VILPKLLVVEDNPSDVFILRRILTEQGGEFEIEVAADGEAALQFVRNQGENNLAQPCVILLDLHLPKYDGLDVLRAIRQEPSLSHVRVIVLSTAASPQEVKELQRLGAGYRQKPSQLSEFADLAAEVIALCK